MAKKKLAKNLRIVCEGENTAPNYFKYLANKSEAKEKWGSIKITPAPKEDEKPIKATGSNLNRPSREFTKIESFTPPQAHKAVPMRYVAEILADLAAATYSEGWAVYDKNGHPKHAEAWKLKGDKVNIALSCRSFEHWILLHFEKNINPFIATECKVEGKKDKLIPNSCGTTKAEDDTLDCVKQANIICLVGYLRYKHAPNYGKSLTKAEDIRYFDSLMKILESRLDIAFENAAWLRFKMYSQLKSNLPFLVNPYTNVDELVKSILNISTKFIWGVLNNTLDLERGETIIVNIDVQNIYIKYIGSFNLKRNISSSEV
jgi:hypothetical protein